MPVSYTHLFRFEPGVTYKVSFDYQAGSDGIYGVVVGDGEFNGTEEVVPLPMAMGLSLIHIFF